MELPPCPLLLTSPIPSNGRPLTPAARHSTHHQQHVDVLPRLLWDAFPSFMQAAVRVAIELKLHDVCVTMGAHVHMAGHWVCDSCCLICRQARPSSPGAPPRCMCAMCLLVSSTHPPTHPPLCCMRMRPGQAHVATA